jgi:hypothetical protein
MHTLLEAERHPGHRSGEPEGADTLAVAARVTEAREAPGRDLDLLLADLGRVRREGGVLLKPEPRRSPLLRIAQARAVRRLLPRFLFRALRVGGDETGDVDDRLLARSNHPGSQRPTWLAAGADLVGGEGRRQVIRAQLVRIGCGHVQFGMGGASLVPSARRSAADSISVARVMEGWYARGAAKR